MGEGTNVGKIFLDLIVRNTVEKQIREITAEGQRVAQNAFSGVENAAERMACGVTTQTGSVVKKSAAAIERASASLADTFNKPVALAQARLNQLEQTAVELSAKLEDEFHKDFSFKLFGYVTDDNKTVAQIQKQLDKVHSQIKAAEDRLAIEKEAAAQKAAAAAERAALRQAMAAPKAAEKAAAAAQKETLKREAAEQKAAAAAEKAAQKAAAAEAKAANRRKAVTAAMWKNMLSHTGNGAKAIASKISGIGKHFGRASKSANGFGTRLRGLVSGALVFNVLSNGLRRMTSYIGQTLASTDEMRSALANLKGAAANAASPLIQVLTPALAALANTAATVFSYVSRLLTLLTGKISNASSMAAKSASGTAAAAKKASKSLAGFDEINQLGGNSGDSGGGSGNGSIQPNYEFEGKSVFLDSVLAAIEQQQWGRVGVLFAQKINESLARVNWPSIQEKASGWTRNLVDVINGFTGKLDWGLLGSSIGNGLNTVLCVIDTFFQGVDWTQMGRGFGTGLNSMFDATDWAMLGRVLTDKFKALFELFHGFVETFDFKAFGTDLATMLVAGLTNIDWIQLAADLIAAIGGLIDLCSGFIQGINWGKLGKALWDGLASIVRAIDWSKLVSQAVELLASCIVASKALMLGIWKTLFGLLSDAGKRIWAYFEPYVNDAGGDIVQGIWNGVTDALKNAYAWIKKHIFEPFMDGFRKAFGIHSPSTVMKEQGGFIIAGLLNGITSAWKKITSFFSEALSSVKTRFSSAFTSLKKTVSDIWKNGIVPAIKGPINSIIYCINGMISGMVTGINSVIRALNKLKFEIPDWVPLLGGKAFGFNIQTITAPTIPMLASGGVITQPTLAMMGEYAGARNNPEIVAPQSIIADTVAGVLESAGEGKAAVLEKILTVLLDIDRLLQLIAERDGVNITFAGELAALARILKPYIDKENRRVGGSLVKGG